MRYDRDQISGDTGIPLSNSPTTPSAAAADLAANQAKARTPLLPRELSDEELAVFAAVSTRRDLVAGEIVFRHGEVGRCMYIIESGEIRLEFGEDLPDRLIGERTFFGELTLFIGNHARGATAVAARPGTVHVVDHAAFEQLMLHEPRHLAHFMRRSFSYLVASEQQLIANQKRRNEDLLATLNSLHLTQSELAATERLVQTDELTNLCNRRGLYRFLKRVQEGSEMDGALGLLLVDLDQFKRINDHCGHAIGDQVLRAAGQEVLSAAAASDLPCRLGGDEFALLTYVANIEELEMRAAQIASAIRSLRFPSPNQHLRISVSIGGGMCALDQPWANWYSEADAALYDIKARGGDGWLILGSGAMVNRPSASDSAPCSAEPIAL